MLVVGIVKVINKEHHNKEDFILHQCVRHRSRDALNCSKLEQLVQLVSSFVLTVCKLTVLDCVLHMQVCRSTETVLFSG